MFEGEICMKTALIKIMIGILPTAFSADALEHATIEDNSDNSVQIDKLIEDYDGNYPTIYNIGEVNVQVGDSFDPLAGVYAIDSKDDLTSDIEVSGDVDTNTEGQYVLNYKVTAEDGSWYENSRLVTVSQEPSTELPKSPSKSKEGPRVTFKNVKDVTVSQGESFDPKKDITVIDTDGYDITEDVYIVGDEVNTDKPGEYYIAYTVIDRFGKPNAKAITVTVE